jgi:GNAT superfamily N-acetyltransferase
MNLRELDDRLIEAHQSLVKRGVIEPLANGAEAGRWQSCELASLVEGHFHHIVDVGASDASERRQWERRVTESGDRLRDPQSDEFRRAYWLLRDGVRVGTLAIDSVFLPSSPVRVSSLYVLPEFRGRGTAARALDATYHAVVAAGANGIRLETSWCWQAAVRYYLRLGFWLRNWKHSLLFVRMPHLCPYRVDIDGARARFSLQLDGTWTPWIEADDRGTSLGWKEIATSSLADDSLRAVRHVAAASTFALHLAVHGWPLIRSPDLWERRYDWCDSGMPEGLACKIAVFEAVARERGYDVRTPRIPGLDYDAA